MDQHATLEGGDARIVAEFLLNLGELPSTPPEIAAEARSRSRDLASALPIQAPHHQPGARDPGPAVTLPRAQCVRIAGLLELFAGLPSTPPDVASEASERAERVWAACGSEAS